RPETMQCGLCRGTPLARPGASSAVIIIAPRPGLSGRSLDMSGVTLGSSAIAMPVMQHSRTNATSLIVIVALFRSSPGTSSCRRERLVRDPGRTSDAGSGCRLCAAEPFVEADAAEARLAQRHQRVLLHAAADGAGP